VPTPLTDAPWQTCGETSRSEMTAEDREREDFLTVLGEITGRSPESGYRTDATAVFRISSVAKLKECAGVGLDRCQPGRRALRPVVAIRASSTGRSGARAPGRDASLDDPWCNAKVVYCVVPGRTISPNAASRVRAVVRSSALPPTPVLARLRHPFGRRGGGGLGYFRKKQDLIPSVHADLSGNRICPAFLASFRQVDRPALPDAPSEGYRSG